MNIYISIDGVLRNTIQKINYHYNDYYLNTDSESGETAFQYSIIEPIMNNNLMSSFTFQSKDEYNHFMYIEFPIEIYGHAGLSYSNTFTELNKMIFDNPQHNFVIIGLDEFGKAKPATLFFLSKNGFLGNNIKFIKTEQIQSEWENCDVWITDCKEIIDNTPENKKSIKFQTKYNEFFNHDKEINKLSEIQSYD